MRCLQDRVCDNARSKTIRTAENRSPPNDPGGIADFSRGSKTRGTRSSDRHDPSGVAESVTPVKTNRRHTANREPPVHANRQRIFSLLKVLPCQSYMVWTSSVEDPAQVVFQRFVQRLPKLEFRRFHPMNSSPRERQSSGVLDHWLVRYESNLEFALG
jgi:hypothetical protein